MPYIDVDGQVTWEKRAGEAILAPEHFVATCGCGRTATGRLDSRSKRELASQTGWIYVETPSRLVCLYCSPDCVEKVQQP